MRGGRIVLGCARPLQHRGREHDEQDDEDDGAGESVFELLIHRDSV